MPTILIDEPVHPSILNLFPDGWKLVYLTDNPSPDELASIDAYFVYAHPTVDRAFMERTPNLKIAANFGVGVGHINIADAAAMGIPVTNTPGILQRTVAEVTAGLILAVTRQIVGGHQYATGPKFDRYDPHLFWGKDLRDAALGIVGMGQIGTEVARVMKHGFGMEILYHNRNRVDPTTERQVDASHVSLDELLQRADVLVLTARLTELTKNMIGPRELGLMRPGAYLVNVSRGGLLDQDALVRSLESGHLAGAALDVTEPEPLPRDHPLLSMSNVVITPHVGSATLQTRMRMGQRTIENIESVLLGNGPLDRVT